MRRFSTAEARLSTGEPPAKAGAAAHRSCLTYGDVPGSRAAIFVRPGRALEPHTFGITLISVEIEIDPNPGLVVFTP